MFEFFGPWSWYSANPTPKRDTEFNSGHLSLGSGYWSSIQKIEPTTSSSTAISTSSLNQQGSADGDPSLYRTFWTYVQTLSDRLMGAAVWWFETLGWFFLLSLFIKSQTWETALFFRRYEASFSRESRQNLPINLKVFRLFTSSVM